MMRLHVRVLVLIGLAVVTVLATALSLRGPSTAQADPPAPGTSSLMNRLSANGGASADRDPFAASPGGDSIPSAQELFGGPQQPDHTIVQPTEVPPAATNTGSTLQIVPRGDNRYARQTPPPAAPRSTPDPRTPDPRTPDPRTPDPRTTSNNSTIRFAAYEEPTATTPNHTTPSNTQASEPAAGPALSRPETSAYPNTAAAPNMLPAGGASSPMSAAADPFGDRNDTSDAAHDSYPATTTPSYTPPSYPATTTPSYGNTASEPRRFDPPAEVSNTGYSGGTNNYGAVRSSVDAAGSGRPGNRELEGPQTPALEVEKLAPAEVQVGKAATFEIRVRNVGHTAAHDVVLEDDVPQGTQLVSTKPQAKRGSRGELTWSLGTLKPSEETVVKVELMPTTEGELGSVARAHFAAEASVRTISTRPLLDVEVEAPREVLIGESLTLRIKVSNPGTGVATGVLISEHVPDQFEHPAGAELEHEIGNLAPGESRELKLSLKAVRPGPTANLVLARGDGALQAEEKSPLFVVAPDLKVAIDGKKRSILNRKTTYTLNVANPGTAAAEEVRLVSYLPAGMDFVDANNAGEYDPQTHSVQWLLAELPARQQGSVSLTMMPTEAGEQTLRVASTAQRGLVVEAKEDVLVEGVAAVLFQVADEVDPIEVGGETSYEVHVVNQGSKTATNVQIVALLPPEMKAVSAEGPTRYQIEGSQVRFQPLQRLAPQDDVTYRLRVQGLAPGDLRIRIQLSSDDVRTPITKEESTHVYSDK